MKTINTLIIITLLALLSLVAYVYTSKPALAATDFTCMSRCTAQGYMYGYCQKVCSY